MIKKKLVVVPNYLPKTTLEVDASLKGKELEKHIKDWIESTKRIPSDVASTMWKSREPIPVRKSKLKKKRK